MNGKLSFCPEAANPLSLYQRISVTGSGFSLNFF